MCESSICNRFGHFTLRISIGKIEGLNKQRLEYRDGLLSKYSRVRMDFTLNKTIAINYLIVEWSEVDTTHTDGKHNNNNDEKLLALVM